MRNGSATIVFALTGTILVNCPGKKSLVECKSFIAPPGAPFTSDVGDSIVAVCMLDVFCRDYAVLLNQMQQQAEKPNKHLSFEIKDEQDYINTLLAIYHKQYTGPSAEAAVEQLFAPPERLKELVHPIDERVKEVISIIESNIDQNISIEVLARKVNLSVPHLVKIFKAQTGVPIRRYRLWHRLFVASVLMSKTDNLTTAALNAGFSDASHFLHTFQNMLGMKASLLLKQPNDIKIIT